MCVGISMHGCAQEVLTFVTAWGARMSLLCVDCVG